MGAPLSSSRRPLVAITTDIATRSGRELATCALDYAARLHAAGATPVLIPPLAETAEFVADRFDAFVFTGGDDPATEPFGVPTHPKVTLVHPHRQRFEMTLLLALADRRPDAPVLGVCLGMQMMALVAGGRLDQYMPETTPDAERHWDAVHPIEIVDDARHLRPGDVHSRHKQAVSDPGALTVAARADDAVIEAVCDPARAFYLGVQWHPERTDEPALGQSLFDALVDATRAAKAV